MLRSYITLGEFKENELLNFFYCRCYPHNRIQFEEINCFIIDC